jgi:hypothetical protein
VKPERTIDLGLRSANVQPTAGGTKVGPVDHVGGRGERERQHDVSEYERQRTLEVAMRVEYQKIRIQKLKGEVVATKYIAEMIDATFAAIKAKILALDLTMPEKIDILDELASVPLILESAIEKTTEDEKTQAPATGADK